MKLVITDSIRKKEVDILSKIFSLDVIKAAAKKSLSGLGISIKSSQKVSGTNLKKLKLTSSGGAGRVIFLIQINSEKSVLVMLRPKNDKEIGANMTTENKKFKKVLDKNLDLIIEDLKTHKYMEYELS